MEMGIKMTKIHSEWYAGLNINSPLLYLSTHPAPVALKHPFHRLNLSIRVERLEDEPKKSMNRVHFNSALFHTSLHTAYPKGLFEDLAISPLPTSQPWWQPGYIWGGIGDSIRIAFHCLVTANACHFVAK